MVLSKKSKLVVLEEVLEKHPGQYEKASIARVRDFVAFVEENSVPKDKIPYQELDFPDFDLYFQLVSQWRHKPKEYIRNDEEHGGKYFFDAVKQKCRDEIGYNDFEAEAAMTLLIADCNRGIVTTSLMKARPVNVTWALRPVYRKIQEMKKKNKKP
jgi:hypothetical protein